MKPRLPASLALLTVLALSSSCRKSTPPSKAPHEASAEGPSLAPAALVEASPSLTDAEVRELLEDEDEVTRHRMPRVEGPIMERGIPGAPIEITVFFDYQCPYCHRLNDTLNEVLTRYGDRVHISYRQFPLPFHKAADELGAAALAAAEVGAFDQVHDQLFEIARESDIVAAIGRVGAEAGLETMAFNERYSGDEAQAWLDMHEATGKALGVRSTPTWFVNGRVYKGALPLEKVEEAIDEELGRVQRLIAAGVPRSQVASRIAAAAVDEPIPQRKPSRDVRPGRPDPAKAYAVPTDARPSRGPDDALITIVEFSDFECPFCKRVEPTLDALLRRYPHEVRIVFRHNPLPMHKNARIAAQAAWAAGQQGKFWEMHELLFDNSRDITDANLETWARKLKLDLRRFNRDRQSDAAKKAVEQDQAVARNFGASGTPAFFINGRFLSGAQPEDAFVTLIEQELPKARAALNKRGGKRQGLYEELIAGHETKVVSAAAAPIADDERRTMSYKGLPRRGPKNAPIQMLMCSDFDCPFCARAVGILDELDKRYPNKIALYHRHQPLPMHKGAEPAARFAWAAQQQGKFWEVWRALYEGQSDRRGQGTGAADAAYETIAKKTGVKWSKARGAMASATAKHAVAEDMKICTEHGARGTPTFFINGRKVSGAQPADRFATVIDEELARKP